MRNGLSAVISQAINVPPLEVRVRETEADLTCE